MATGKHKLNPLIFLPSFSNHSLTLLTIGKHETHQLKATDLFDVSHITAIVTGGGTGIGLMITQALVANGAKVYITGRRKEVLESTIEQYSKGGPGSMHALAGDISDKDEVLRIVKEIEEKEPKGIHLLVNNAGIALDQATQFCKHSSTPPSNYHSSLHTLHLDTQAPSRPSKSNEHSLLNSQSWPARHEISRINLIAFLEDTYVRVSRYLPD